MKGMAFYEAAAQIIPVLLIVLALEGRYFARQSRLERWMAFLYLDRGGLPAGGAL